jgi:DeoR family fructose operon transcriptional repressor
VSAIYPFERKEKILEKLRNEGQITISEDSRRLGISTSTLHRDLEQLEAEGIVKKVRGGAVLAEASRFETHFDIRMKTRVEEKKEIARVAVHSVNDDSAIFLDHSSTSVYLAREIRRCQFRNLVILTNSLVIPTELAEKKGVRVMLTGGVVENEFKALSGRWVVESLQKLNIHKVFASVGAISPDRGLMTQVPFIHEILPEIFSCGGDVNILVDSSKFFKIGTFQLAPLSSSLKIFTDKALPRNLREQVERLGPRVIS